MAENFYVEALVLMIFTYVILIIIILRIALMLCQYTFKNETDQMKRTAKKQSSSLQNVIIVKSNENKRNSNRNHSLHAYKKYPEYSERPVKNYNLPIPEKHQIISADSSKESKQTHSVAKQDCSNVSKLDVIQSKFITPPSVSSGVTKSQQERINDDDSFWRQSFQDESELSKESTTIPNTSAYGMRKIGKKTYIDDTNIGSPRSKALEEKSYEHIEVPESNRTETKDKAVEPVHQANT